MSYCKRCDGPCEGPCFDYCDCRHCWNGWKGVSLLTRLRWRSERIIRDLSDGVKVVLCALIGAAWWGATVALYLTLGGFAAIFPQALIALVMSLVLARDLWRLND